MRLNYCLLLMAVHYGQNLSCFSNYSSWSCKRCNLCLQTWSCVCPFTFSATTKYHYKWKIFLLYVAQGREGNFPIPVRDFTLYVLLCRSCWCPLHQPSARKINTKSCFCQNKWEIKELDSLLNIHIQRGSYIKARMFKLLSGLLCTHLL